MCATKTCASAITVPTLAPERNGSAVVAAIIAIVEAFQEALEMHRAAQSKYRLTDG
jgi:hypothetical protein